MGTPIDRKEKINELKRSNANNYIAEVFFEELQFILKEDLLDSLMIICHGMNPRVHSKDILSTSLRYFPHQTHTRKLLLCTWQETVCITSFQNSFSIPLS